MLAGKLPLDLLGQHSRHIREIQQLVGIHWAGINLGVKLTMDIDKIELFGLCT
jgi:hypothetical protein